MYIIIIFLISIHFIDKLINMCMLCLYKIGEFIFQGEHVDEFSPFITGPHMDTWSVTVTSKHTDHWFEEKKKKEAEKGKP